MKKIIFFIFKYLIKFFNFLYNYHTFLNLKRLLNRFYSIWISFVFKKVGDNFNVLYPIYITGGKCIQFENCSIDQRLRIDAIQDFLDYKYQPKIIIGNNFSIQKDCHITAINKIIIGDNVLIASKVFITDHMHGEFNEDAIKLPPARRKLYSKGPVIIEDNVWIGENVVILPGVTIGKNSIIGANAVVSKSIPENSIAVGIPAKVIKKIAIC